MKTTDVLECGCEPMEVTSMHRPDTGWKIVDAQGHEHRWHVNGTVATRYDPCLQYETPSLVWVKDGEAIDEDGEPYDVGHSECLQCGEHIAPGYTADVYRCFVPGLRWYKIAGRLVSESEFRVAIDQQKGAL